MSFTGKATYSAGATLPEILEDVSDLVAINSPHETPLLDVLGDAAHAARSTVHEWLEDQLLPNQDTVADDEIGEATTQNVFGVAHATRFRVGDQVRLGGTQEVMLVSAVGPAELTVVRAYGGSTAGVLANGAVLEILGNAALEGDAALAARFTTRSRKTNYTQIFAATVEVSGSELAVRQAGLADELDYQKQQRLRELLRDLENCVINGRAAEADPQGSATTRRTMRGLVASISTHRFQVGGPDFPGDDQLSEEQLNHALRRVWQSSNGAVDLIVVGADQKRRLNQFLAAGRRYTEQSERYKDQLSIYESDFGVCRVILSRWVPAGTVLLLDSSRISVLPLAGRSFHYKPLASTGDRESGQVIGEYTLELRNENAHGLISGLA